MIRRLGILLILATAAGLGSGPARAYAIQATGSGSSPIYLHWTSNPTYMINDQTSDSLANVTAGSDPLEAIRRGFQAWNEISSSTVEGLYGGLTAVAGEGNDGVNVVSFVDDDFTFNGALGVTRIFFSVSTGSIVNADIIFNPAVTFSTSGSAANVYDVQEVATHEIGHFFGMAHTGSMSATMYPFGKDDSQIERFLDPDDKAGLSSNYPDPSLATDYGTVSGTITRNQVDFFGAHVVCMDVAGGPIVSAITLKDGSYSIEGVPPGDYNIFVEPLDGPMSQGNLSGWWTSASFGTAFPSKFKQSQGSKVVLDVDAGATLAGTDINTGTATPLMNPIFVGKGPVGQGLTVATTLTTVLQGDDDVWDVAVAGDGMDSPATFSILGEGATRTSDFSYGTFGGGTPYVFATFSFDGDAPDSPRVVRTSSGGQVSFITGGLEILPFPARLTVNPDPLNADSIYLQWYGSTPPHDLRRDTQRDFTGSSTLVDETDLQERDAVLQDGMDYYYRIDD